MEKYIAQLSVQIQPIDARLFNTKLQEPCRSLCKSAESGYRAKETENYCCLLCLAFFKSVNYEAVFRDYTEINTN